MSSSQQLRLTRINQKGWEVAQKLQAVKAKTLDSVEEIFDELSDGKKLRVEERLRAWLDQINRARKRLQDGDYGLCLSCGKAFSDLELDEMAWVEYCALCDAS
jgi:RNA polymerase-binding transcription factor DksA